MGDADLLVSHLVRNHDLHIQLFILTENSTVPMSFDFLVGEALDGKNIRF